MNSNQQQLPCDNVNNCQPPPLMPRHMASHPAMRPPMSASNHPRAYVPGVNVLRAAGPHQGTSHQGAPHHGGPQHSNSFHNGPHHGSPLADAIHPAQHGIQATINRNADNSMYMTGGRHAHGSASPSTDPVLPSFPGMNTGMANSAPQGNMLSAFTNLNYNTGWNAYDSSQELLPQEEIAKLAECVDSLSRLNSMGHMTDPFGGLPSMERNDQINEGHKLYMAAMRQLSEEYPDTSNPPVSTPDSLSTDYTNTNSNAMSQGYTTPQYSENSSYSPFGSPMFSSDALNSVTNELYRASGSVNTVISSSSDADHSSYTAPASTITTSTCQSKATLCSNITPEEKSQKPSYVDIAKKNAATSSGSCKPAAVSKSKSEGTTTKAPLTEKGLAQETAKKATDGKRMKSLSSKSSDNSFGVDSSDDGSKSGFSIPKQTSKAASSKQTNKHKSDTKSPEKEEKLFFDPKRIFAPRPVKSQSTSNTEKKTEPLNNGKPKQNQTKCGIEKSNTSSFINNDLSYDWKQTNCDRHMADSTYKSEQTTKSNVTDPKLHRRTGDKKSMASKKFDRQKGGSDLYRKIRKTKDDNMKVVMGVYFHKFWTYIKDIIVWLLTVICDVTIMLLKLTYLLCLIFLQFCIVYAVRGYRYVSAKIFKSEEEEGNEWSRLFSRTTKKESECNIPLPSTGDEAMKRLLSCKDKDPYSILGVKSDAPDDIIKKYYRRQAVLVHPDKNKQPGAEEAFKILGHAFDLIGEPEKRETYDAEISKTRGMEEFADLLTKLHEKTQEAANQMGCNICEGKHRRVLTERRPWCDARFCEKCQIFHSAKEGDVWAETRMCGFIWHYYACMDSKVFDITEWAKCQHARFKRMQPNSHQVIYRLASNGKKHNQRNEPDIDEFLNQIFRQAGVDGYDGTPQPENERAPRPNTSNKKKNRKKKR